MWILWRILPLCGVAFSLWRVIPAMKAGSAGFGAAQAITSINAVNLANSMQGELGAAMGGGGGGGDRPLHMRKAVVVVHDQKSKVQLDGWGRPFKVSKQADQIEVVSCGEDGECGTTDDIIEVVRADGKRTRMEAGQQDRAAKPLR